ncbi:DinB family protein [Streptomyces sp. NBC_00846]|uniref:mycothiol transferase n=1 Tax=Streptomyces sp. NBC_00846 TaxID=2975849 RepID=UPI003869BE75|nr:DinB family protein [Streptomyces sp. NBC_00846]
MHKCAGLTGKQLAEQTVSPSNLTLLGLIRHMAKVERTWFRQRFAGQTLDPMYDPGKGKEADFEDVDPSRAAEDYARVRMEAVVGGGGGPDRSAPFASPDFPAV